MKTMFYDGDSPNSSNLCLAVTKDGKGLEVFERNNGGWSQRGAVDLGTHRLFRPDHDVQFISDTGKVWEPNF